MSEYQYYEFQAIDRPLTVDEMATLRHYSTRARITPTSFVNEYNWGDFKGDTDAWMAKYFDAFLYLANWGTRIFKLRLPSRLLPADTTQLYCDGDCFAARYKGDHVVLTCNLEEEPGDDWEEGAGQLAALVPVRAELARGDRRALYLGWLLAVQHEAHSTDTLEPPVPPGLGQLSASLDSLVEFLRIDRDLVAVAAEASEPSAVAQPEASDLAAWLAMQPVRDKDEWLARLVLGDDPALSAELLQRHLAEREPSALSSIGSAPRRTAGELLNAAGVRRNERSRIAAGKAAVEKARRKREAAAARARHVDSLAGREPQLWREIEELAATKLPKNYDHAVKLLGDLRDLAARGDSAGFQLQLAAFRNTHARKPSLLARLQQAGLGNNQP
jgi:hypothetical protein